MNHKRYGALLIGGFLLLAAALLLSILLGSVMLTPAQLWQALFTDTHSAAAHILRYSRWPRTLAALLAGAALAAAGAVLQNVLSNKLASPGIIGVNAGAGCGVTLCCALGLLSGWWVSVFAFGGSLLATAVIFLFASGTGASKTTVILGGVALNSLLGACSEAMAVLDTDVAALSAEFRVGGFSSVSYTRLLPAAVIIVLSLLVLFTLFNELDIVSLGDETAQSVGLPVKTYRLVFLVLAALLAGAAVSFAGLLGFVGLLVPHGVRRLAGGESRHLLPLSVLYGGSFVCLCDTLSRVLFAPYELPVGILMAAIGGPAFVFLLVKMKGGHSHAAD